MFTITPAIAALFASADCGSAPEPGTVTFRGAVNAGETYLRWFDDGISFCLDPTEHGWCVAVREDGSGVDLARLTPPFHFAVNPRNVEGWHFRNADNTGPNVPGPLNVNAPQSRRTFIFSLGVTSETPATREEVERVRAAGGGEIRVLECVLSPYARGQQARILSMKFEVTLRWR